MPQHQPLFQAIRVAADPVTVLQRIVEQALVLLPQADGAVLEIRRDQETLEYLVGAGTLGPSVGLRLPLQGSLSGLSILTGEIQLCIDALEDPRVNSTAVAATGVRSMLCVPLSDHLSSVAVLKVSSTQVGAFNNDDAEQLRLLARYLNTTIDAATDLAVVTADVLAELDRLVTPEVTRLDWQRGTAQFVANVMTPGLVDQVLLQRRVESVLSSGALDIVFQPVVDLQSERIVSCEALSRFHASTGQSPDWWFEAAHRVGLGVELELLAVRRALELIPQVPESLPVAVNVGPRTILSPEFLQLMETTDLSRLTLELTEHEALQDYEAILTALHPLRQQGLRLSVDDTGSGYSGLTHILRLKPDIIKLDREMVTGIHADPVRRALATALVSFAEAIGSHVIAEGLEVREEVTCLRQLAVGYAQGYVYWKPLPLDVLIACSVTPSTPLVTGGIDPCEGTVRPL